MKGCAGSPSWDVLMKRCFVTQRFSAHGLYHLLDLPDLRMRGHQNPRINSSTWRGATCHFIIVLNVLCH